VIEPVGPTLRSERLVLRPWRDDDLEPMAALNADPETMRYFPSTLSREQSDRFVVHMTMSFAAHGFAMWAVEVTGGPPLVGAVGLLRPSFEAHFTPAVEVGWRLAKEHWGMGYATEAARAAIDFGFSDVGLEEIVSFTAAVNAPSRAVMERLGMHRDPDGDFPHPNVPPGPLRQHVLYRLPRPLPAGR
jgi:ribosomal-protein-alanine N-acetyltransferase